MNQVISILGCGWLGKELGKTLVSSGFQVMGSTTRSEKVIELESVGIKPFVLTVNELPEAGVAQQFFHCDVLVISLPHGVRRGNGDAYVDQINIVMDAVTRGNVKHLLLISTTSVYPNLNRIVTEEDADPNNPIVKAERIVLKSGLPSTVLRFAGLYGPGRHPGKFLANKSNIAGANAPVNLIHLDDCVQIIKTIITNDVWNEVLSACADGHPTKKVFYTNAALSIGLNPPTFSNEVQDYKIVSNERIKAILNYEFVHSVR